MTVETATIRELIDRMAEIQPLDPFLVSPESGEALTFGALREQSMRLASRMREAGLEPGDKVAFLLDNGLFTAVLFLGSMYGGLVSVPLNPRAGVTQLSYSLDHCDAKVVCVGAAYRGLLQDAMSGIARPIRILPAEVADLDRQAPEAGVPTEPIPAPAPGDPALLMYTSGSTGNPKAAVHSHRTVLAGAANSIQSHQLTSSDRSLLVLPLYHINAECVTLVPTLMSGGSVVVPHRFDVSQFWDLLDEYQCTWSAVVPTIISQLLDWQDPRAGDRGPTFARIRFLRSSSAPLSPSLHREFLSKFPLLLIQAMGSTECGNIFSNPLPPGENKIGSPGLPWGFETRIIDREGADVPPGEPGEVLLRGPAMTQGYYKDADGSTTSVIDGDGWLHTGDLAYQDQDGYFFVVGRSKELVIKGGVNIAPKQIDEVLESHAAVLEAAAVGVPDRYLGEDLIAFVVLRSGMTCTEHELLTLCEARLGHFKTPTRIHFAEDLPKGPSGKVQRLRLLEGAALSRTAPAPPATAHITTPIEQIIAETWSEALQQPQIDVDDNFFALGGHSILAIQCLSQLREKLPVALSLSDFFENATVAQQAELMRKRLGSTEGGAQLEAGWEHQVLQQLGASPDQPIPLRDRSRPCPLSPAQRRLWFMNELLPGIPVYNESEAVFLRGELNVGALGEAFNHIVRRHEILRSTVSVVDGDPVVNVHESWPLRVKRIDLSALPPQQRQAEVDRLLVEEPRLSYRLEVEPGIRVTLLRLGPREHVLILMMHHLITDWASVGVIWRELSAAYRAIARGHQPAMPPLPIQHGDYAAWQQVRMTDDRLAEDLAYWEKTLQDSPDLLELPSDRPRPTVNTYEGERQRFRIGARLARIFRDSARREKVSLFTLFTAALDALLYRYSGQQDIALGIPLAARDRDELRSVIGFLLHTHVLRTPVSGDVSFRELIQRVQKGVIDLYAHRAVPFDQVVARLRPARDLSYSPLFQVMLNWRDREQQLSYVGLDGLEVEGILAETRTAKFDLTLMLTDDGDEIGLEIEYNTSLFEPDRIQRMVGHLQVLLEAAAADPDRTVAALPLLTETEQRQALLDWNRTEAAYPGTQCVPELIEAQARRTPDAVAVVFGDRRLTYRELDRQASRVACRLQTIGVGADTLVAICADRSLEMVVGMLGILKAGGAYVPLDPAHPAQRLAAILEDSAASVLVTQRALVSAFPYYAGGIVCLDDPEWQQSPDAGISEDHAVGASLPDHLAYVIYTSGSTGAPKGVQISHRALVNLLIAMQAQPGITAADTLAAVTTISFDIAGLEIWLPLITGARVVLVGRETAGDGRELAALLERSRITVMQATPATWKLLLAAGWKGKPDLKILCGGEALPLDVARELLPRCRALWNMYGPTETTIWSLTRQITAEDTFVPIGKPIANTTVYVLDGHQQPVPVGVPGELYIGGDGLARGYLNLPALTAEKFVPDPFGHDHSSRLYRTGDLVRWHGSGDLEFLGRLDHQVKIRGFRIELGEIESCLGAHPSVRDVAVVAREDSAGDQHLVAYVVAGEASECDGAGLRSYVKAALPEYMVPSRFVLLDAMPLTPSGKIDRRRLPEIPPVAPARGEEKRIDAGTPTERAVVEVYRELLGAEQVLHTDTFVDLGGHSLQAMKAIARLEAALGVRLTPRDILIQTVGQVAATCEESLAVAPAGRSPGFLAPLRRLWKPLEAASRRRAGSRGGRGS